MNRPAATSQPAEHTTIDPVCGGAVRADRAPQSYQFRNVTYYFDRSECLKQFLEDPDKFISN